MASFGLDLQNDTTGGDPNFRLDVGAVISRSFGVWGANLLSFTLVGVVVLSPVLLGLGLLALAGATQPLVERILGWVSNILTLALTGGVTYGVFQDIRGERASAGDVLRMGMSKLGTVWGTGILAGLAIALGFCALIVPGLILMVRFWLAVPVAVIESPGASASLSRSTDLTEGNRWRIFAVSVLMFVVQLVATLIVGAGIAFVTGAASSAALEPTKQTAGVQFLLELLVIPIAALAAVAPAIAYHDIRKGKEGADVEELLKAFD
jgi:MFS family permease